MFKELIELDKQFFLYLNGMGAPFWDSFWLYMSRTLSFVTIPIFLFLVFYLYQKFGYKKTAIAIITVSLLLLCTEQLSVLVKQGTERLRPCYDNEIQEVMRSVKSYCGGRYSYFSAHAANSFALASFFSILFKKETKVLGFILLIWALLVSYSRIYIGVHFPLDVITGISVGVLLGWFFAKLYVLVLGKI